MESWKTEERKQSPQVEKKPSVGIEKRYGSNNEIFKWIVFSLVVYVMKKQWSMMDDC